MDPSHQQGGGKKCLLGLAGLATCRVAVSLQFEYKGKGGKTWTLPNGANMITQVEDIASPTHFTFKLEGGCVQGLC